MAHFCIQDQRLTQSLRFCSWCCTIGRKKNHKKLSFGASATSECLPHPSANMQILIHMDVYIYAYIYLLCRTIDPFGPQLASQTLSVNDIWIGVYYPARGNIDIYYSRNNARYGERTVRVWTAIVHSWSNVRSDLLSPIYRLYVSSFTERLKSWSKNGQFYDLMHYFCYIVTRYVNVNCM